jgi:hypothetical protein
MHERGQARVQALDFVNQFCAAGLQQQRPARSLQLNMRPTILTSMPLSFAYYIQTGVAVLAGVGASARREQGILACTNRS